MNVKNDRGPKAYEFDCSLLRYRETVVQRSCRTVADPDVEVRRFHNPTILRSTPVVPLFATDREADLLFLTGQQCDTTETFQLTNRSRCRTETLMKIQLNDLVRCACTSIRNRYGCRDRASQRNRFSA